MKAMILAAGLGTRLQPLTDNIPKPMILINGKPLMDYILVNLIKAGVTDVIANLYSHPNIIIDRYEHTELVKFNYIVEQELSGTAGGLKKCEFFFDDDFIVISGDILTDIDLSKAVQRHKQLNAIATVCVKEVDTKLLPNYGVVVLSGDNIVEFQEKPSITEAKSNIVNTGIYIFSPEIFKYISKNTFTDFANHVFPVLVKENKLNYYKFSDYWNDIGTLEQYKQALIDKGVE